MDYKKEVAKKLKEFKGTFDNDNLYRSYNIMVVTPAGMAWKANGLHIICQSWYKGSGAKCDNQMWEEIWRMMEYGIEKCTDNECEHCNPIEE